MENISVQGWKTYLAAAAAILTGIVALLNGSVTEGIAAILGGLALLGLRGAAAKIIELLQTLVKQQRQGG